MSRDSQTHHRRVLRCAPGNVPRQGLFGGQANCGPLCHRHRWLAFRCFAQTAWPRLALDGAARSPARRLEFVQARREGHRGRADVAIRRQIRGAEQSWVRPLPVACVGQETPRCAQPPSRRHGPRQRHRLPRGHPATSQPRWPVDEGTDAGRVAQAICCDAICDPIS